MMRTIISEYETEKQAMQGAGRQLNTTHCFARAFAAAGNGRRPTAKRTNWYKNREIFFPRLCPQLTWVIFQKLVAFCRGIILNFASFELID